MSRTDGRIAIPRNVGDVLDLATDVYTKHMNDGASSPLLKLDGIDWAEIGPTIPIALTLHKQAENLKRQTDEAYRERDIYLNAIEEAVKASRNLLKSHNQKNPKRLGEWGFDVADSVQAPKPAKAK
ncbi:MAG TPA: hypothetical protein VFC67_18460 [Prolixibacteraceae bacterium]|nr:hypothetical protein [Prolixibacteraceae bacterium]